MTITYRNSGGWGAGKGSNLTSNEVDLNFYEIASRLTTLENNPKPVDTISNISVSSNYITFYTLSGGVFGPYFMPSASLQYRGAFQASTQYNTNDVVSFDTGIFVCQNSFTSPSNISTFDPSTYLVTGQQAFWPLVDNTNTNLSALAQSPTGTNNKMFTTNSTGDAILVDLPNFLNLGNTPSSFSGKAFHTLGVNSAQTALEFIKNTTSIGFSVTECPEADLCVTIPITRTLQIPTNASGSIASSGSLPTTNYDISIKKNGSSIGTLRFKSAGTPTYEFLNVAQNTFNAGDILTFWFPSTPDANITNIGVSILLNVVP